MSKNILSLNSKEAMCFFLCSKRYHNFELPEYFTFDKILDFVKDTIGDKPYEECISDTLPDDLDDVNMEIRMASMQCVLLLSPILIFTTSS